MIVVVMKSHGDGDGGSEMVIMVMDDLDESVAEF